MEIEINNEGWFYCSWYAKNGVDCLWEEGETPKELKAKVLDALPSYIDKSKVKFSFIGEYPEPNHDEIEAAIEQALKKYQGKKDDLGRPYIVSLWDKMYEHENDEAWPDILLELLKQ